MVISIGLSRFTRSRSQVVQRCDNSQKKDSPKKFLDVSVLVRRRFIQIEKDVTSQKGKTEKIQSWQES